MKVRYIIQHNVRSIDHTGIFFSKLLALNRDIECVYVCGLSHVQLFATP